MVTNYLTQSAQLIKKTGTDAYSKPTYATAVNIKCRVDEKIKIIKNTQGDTIQIDATAFIEPSVDIDNDDKFTYNGRNYKVFQTSAKDFINSNSHQEVLLKAI